MIDVQKIKDLMEAKDMDAWELHNRSGLAYPTVKKILSGEPSKLNLKRLHLRTVQKIAETLGVPPIEIDPEFIEEKELRLRETVQSRSSFQLFGDFVRETEIAPLARLVQTVSTLTPEDELRVVELVEGFVSLTPEQQETVTEFIAFMQSREKNSNK